MGHRDQEGPAMTITTSTTITKENGEFCIAKKLQGPLHMSVLANTTRLCSRVAKFLVMTLLSHQCAVMDPKLC